MQRKVAEMSPRSVAVAYVPLRAWKYRQSQKKSFRTCLHVPIYRCGCFRKLSLVGTGAFPMARHYKRKNEEQSNLARLWPICERSLLAEEAKGLRSFFCFRGSWLRQRIGK